ncbi:MAG: beta-hydroxyacyl-ACP dehydratase [Firmicutes bacterium]|nr:beta-hydroxyacyl-ACP dehydratase [Bacillota bacterium]
MKYTGKEIENLLPHRAPMLLIEDVELVKDDEGERSIAHYNVRGNEYFLQGHFPDFPVVPGVILCEMMAQSCCVFFSNKKDVHTMLTSLNNVKFKSPVRPGDVVRIETIITKSNRIFTFAESKVFVGEKLAAMGELSFALVPKN